MENMGSTATQQGSKKKYRGIAASGRLNATTGGRTRPRDASGRRRMLCCLSTAYPKARRAVTQRFGPAAIEKAVRVGIGREI
jgi:hypothetical protein